MEIQISKSLIPILILSAAFACGPQEKVAENTSADYGGRSDVILLSASQVSAAGISLGSVERRQVFEKVKANGYFEAPPQNRAQVSTFYKGYVKSTLLLVGDTVKKGQVIAILENPEYIKLQQKFMEVNGQLGYLKSEYERKKVLREEDIASQKSLLKAEAEYKSALARHTGLKQELQMMGFNLNNIRKGEYTSSMVIRAPIGGTVTDVNMVIGQHIGTDEILLEIIDTDHLHIELNIFEKDVLKIKEGQPIRLRVPSLGDRIYEGEVYLVGKAFEEEKRTVNVHGHLNDERTEFIPGTYIEAEILVDSDTIEALPEEAIISQAGRDYVFTATGQEGSNQEYQRVEVKTGLKSEGWVEVRPVDDSEFPGSIVVEGVYFLSSFFEQKDHDH